MKAPLRPVALPPGAPGRLLLSAMPGRFDPLPTFLASAAAAGVSRVASLADPAEIALKSPDYAAARASGALPFPVIDHPVRDYGAPADPAAFAAFVEDLAGSLRRGETVAIHCAAGIGRTGLAAQRVLQALGLDADEAAARVRAAGSQPETAAQRDFLGGEEK
ncbi:MAG: tyrosine-protein phosphatase [Rubrimonas sp.]|uniref:tyrosine-protein phosphatase n=1 Tax=Rubrimonas sp. TaxID=2036015 RepID=UPI002FDE67A1